MYRCTDADDLVDRRLLAGVRRPLQREVRAQLRVSSDEHLRPSPPELSTKERIQVTSEADVLTSLAKRLRVTEKELQEKTRLLSEAQEALAQATSQIAKLQAERGLQDELRLYKHRLRCADDQIHQMAAFLADYGLVWIGDQRRGSSRGGSTSTSTGATSQGSSRPGTCSEPGERANEPAAATPPSTRPCDIAALRAAVSGLNVVAEDGCGRIICGAQGEHRIRMAAPVELHVWLDGLQCQGEFSGWADARSKAILSDILDGYFPYVLKRDFPDGVPLKVVDHSAEQYHDPLAGACSQAYVKRLPKAVIRNGQVINVQHDIAELLGMTAEPPVRTVIQAHGGDDAHAGGGGEPAQPDGGIRPLTTIKVKREDGKQTYVLQLAYDDRIRDVLDAVKSFRLQAGQPGADTAIELRSAFPSRVFTDLDETLQQAGLVPNACLHIHNVKQ